MLEFITALLVVFLYPDSLLLPAIHGFTVQLFAVILGTIVGDWVDIYPRMKGAPFFFPVTSTFVPLQWHTRGSGQSLTK